MECSKCQTINPDNAKFCAGCGSVIELSFANNAMQKRDGCFVDGMKRWLDFEGRATRGQYWCFILFQWIIIAAFINIMALGALVGVEALSGLIAGNNEDVSLALILLIMTPYLITMIPSIAIATRRLHDSNKSGWMQLLIVIPYIGALILFIIYLLPSSEGSNRYGEAVK